MKKRTNTSKNVKQINMNKTLKELNLQKSINVKLNSLIGVTSIIASSLDKKIVLKSILDQTKILMECNEGSVLLVDKEKNQLYFAVVSNENDMEKMAEIRLEKGEGIAGTVWMNGKTILIKDAGKDSRFSKKVDKKLDYKTESLIAVPLIVDNEIIGVMEAINKNDKKGFNRFDLNIFQTLSVQAAIAIQHATLYEMAITDGMTGLFIRRYFQRRLKEEFNRAERYNRNLSLIMLDIDHFKNFNDNYGHQFGDEVLKRIACQIKKNSRNSDIPTRYGGEEFAIILPETGKVNAIKIAERIRKIIESCSIEYNDKKTSVTVSVGLSSFKENSPKNEVELIEIADRALYDSKKSGRNRINYF